MNRRSRVLTLAVIVLWSGAVTGRSAAIEAQYSARPAANVPTFARDVAPILYKNCVECHRPGQIAPMSLLTYAETRPWARAIRDEVSDGTMPPWHADAPHGTFLNERRLSDAEKATLVQWANGGAPRGNDADMPAAPEFPADGWIVGQPDAVFAMEKPYELPAEGTIQYEYIYIPTNFTEPKWVKSIEIQPGNREVVHHVLVYYRAKPDLQREPVLKFAPTAQLPREREPGIRRNPPRPDLGPQRLLATYAPGTQPQVAPAGTAFRLEPGGVFELQMHYTTKGEPATDRTKIGLIYSSEPTPLEVRPSHFLNGQFTLPAGAADVAIDAEVEFVQDATVWGLFPHTHLRGTRWEYKMIAPDGTTRTILSVPNYDFNWQTYYMFAEPLKVRKGTRIVSTAWYDNSAANPSNPDPNVDVKWGDQTWEEMQYSGILFTPAAAARPLTTDAADKKR